MKHRIDRLASHGQIVNDDTLPAKGGIHAAQQIETAIAREGWAIGSVIGSEQTLRAQFGLGRRVAREAIRILQSRHAIQMRRGPRGGLVVVTPSQSIAFCAIADYLQGIGVHESELQEAQAALEAMLCIAVDVAADEEWPRQVARIGCDENRVANLFLKAIAEVRRRHLAVQSTEPERTPLGATADIENRPAMIANDLLSRIRSLNAADQTDWLGTEQELSDRYAVGKVVLRQALRILEARGLTQARRGRSGGIHLRVPQARGALEAALSYLSAVPLQHHELVAWATLFGELINELAVARWSDREEVQLRACIADSTHLEERLVMLLVRLEWDACRNPVLALIARCIAAYHVRFVPDNYHATDHELQALRESLVVRTRAISRSDLPVAREAFRHGNRVLARMFRRSLGVG
jgi:DNA-binding FadR family transcriptional regulator